MLKKSASATDRGAWSARHARKARRGQLGLLPRLARRASLARLSRGSVLLLYHTCGPSKFSPANMIPSQPPS